MKRALLFPVLAATFTFHTSLAQNLGPYITPQMFTNLSMDTRTSLNLGTLMGQPFQVTQYSNFKGTPYFTDSFMYCTLMLNDSKVYGKIKMRVNLSTNEIHYLDNSNLEMVAPKHLVRRVAFFYLEKDSVPFAIFSNSYPAIDNNDQLTYYEEMSIGNAFLLKLSRRVIAPQQGLTVSPLDKRFSNVDSWYVFANKKMERWRKGKEFMLFMLDDRKAEVEAYIDKEGIKCKTPAESKKIVDWYNKL